MEFWKSELEAKLAEGVSETKLLLERKEQLEQALVATHFPLDVAQACLRIREQRTSIDLVHDDVEIQLARVRLWPSNAHSACKFRCTHTCMLHDLQAKQSFCVYANLPYNHSSHG